MNRSTGPAVRIATLLIALTGTVASAADLRLHALLDGASVVSATESKGTGEATATLTDDNILRVTLVYAASKRTSPARPSTWGAARRMAPWCCRWACAPAAHPARW